MNLKLSLIFIS